MGRRTRADEAALHMQDAMIAVIFAGYRLRVAAVIRDDGMFERAEVPV